MIIRCPTGLYTAILPQEPQDGGNVTFTISTETPPRSSLLFTELPPAVEQRDRDPRTIPPERRRLDVENRTYTVAQANQSVVGSNRKIVEVGQLLEFQDETILQVDPMLVDPTTEIQHNTNLLDFDALGISTSDQRTIVDSANSLLTQLNEELNQILIDRRDLDIAISENKKQQNENRKATDSLQVLVNNGQDSLQAVIDDLVEQLVVLVEQELQFIEQANALVVLATAKRDEILELAQVVR